MSFEAVKTANFNLMEVLGLAPASLCHAYQQGEWRVHQMDTRWKVQPNQRLLYRAFDTTVASCIGLHEEISQQPRAGSSQALKRKGEPVVSPPKKRVAHAIVISDDESELPSASTLLKTALSYRQTSLHVASTPISASTSHLLPVMCPGDPSTTKAHKIAFATKSSDTTPIRDVSVLGPQQWPTDFFFIDVVKGLEKFDRRLKEGYTQQTAFQDVFGIPCVRQTLSNKRHLLKKVRTNNELLYDTFLAMGHVEEARWPFFESKAEGKVVRGKNRLALLAARALPSCESEEDGSDQEANKSQKAEVDTTSK
jgi:hypothetical protein